MSGRKRWAIALLVLALPACDEPARSDDVVPPPPCEVGDLEQAEVGPFPKPAVVTIAAADGSADAGIADDPAIWVHPTDPALSLVIGTDKDSEGGLRVFDLQGNELQFAEGGRHNNVDLRYGFRLAGRNVDLVAASDRNTNTIDFYTVDAATRRLTAAGSIPTGLVVYGYAMYHNRSTGRYYGIVSSENGVEQWELTGRNDGTVNGSLVRTYTSTTLIEGIAADDELGFVYIAEEDTGIYKYRADPGQPTTRVATVDLVGSSTGLTADVEGLTIYYRRNGLGYLIASSQGNHRYSVYRREGNNEFLGAFTVPQARDTDGIDVTSAALGPQYPFGLFVAQNDDTDFQIVRWKDIADALGLAIDTTGYDVRGRACVDSTAATGTH